MHSQNHRQLHHIVVLILYHKKAFQMKKCPLANSEQVWTGPRCGGGIPCIHVLGGGGSHQWHHEYWSPTPPPTQTDMIKSMIFWKPMCVAGNEVSVVVGGDDGAWFCVDSVPCTVFRNSDGISEFSHASTLCTEPQCVQLNCSYVDWS